MRTYTIPCLSRPMIHSLVSAMLAVSASHCSMVPPRPPAPISYAVPTVRTLGFSPKLSNGTPALVTAFVNRPADSDVFYTLVDPLEAFSARLQLIEKSQYSIDLAYYIWGNDLTGQMMLNALLQAAKRGVRVRLLLDDNNTDGLDALLLAVNRQPNIEVRLFNPLRFRTHRLANYVFDFKRIQRRMHGKIFSVDGQVAIIGGRNIADPYFRVGSNFFFADLELLAAGQIVPSINNSFDRFWNDRLAYPVQGFLQATDDAQQNALLRMSATITNPAALPYVQAAQHFKGLRAWFAGQKSPAVAPLYPAKPHFTIPTAAAILQKSPKSAPINVTNTEENALPQDLLYTNAVFVDDLPLKISRSVSFEQTIGAQMAFLVGHTHQSLDIISPYFVPEVNGTQALVRLAQQGVKVRILTNSLASSDVPAMHRFYAKWRKALLRAGVELYEFKPTANSASIHHWRIREKNGRSASSSLHAKAITWDGHMTYIGSLNLDPRSIWINSELGIMLEGDTIARQISSVFNSHVLRVAYKVSLTPQGQLIWTEQTENGTLKQYHTEPDATFKRLALAYLIGLLPIDAYM